MLLGVLITGHEEASMTVAEELDNAKKYIEDGNRGVCSQSQSCCHW